MAHFTLWRDMPIPGGREEGQEGRKGGGLAICSTGMCSGGGRRGRKGERGVDWLFAVQGCPLAGEEGLCGAPKGHCGFESSSPFLNASETESAPSLSSGKAGKGRARQSKARQSRARQDRAWQGKARQGKARQSRARQGKAK
eukprot:172751-Pelagomonas_calceolata.AAC.6